MDGNGEAYRSKEDFFDKLSESYDQIREISSGGGGIIYQGYHRRLGQKVVLKKIRSDKVSVIGSEREMKILMGLKHTYLPRIYDFWQYEDEVYTVMEFIEGRSFEELLDAGETFGEKDVIRWTIQLAEVLEYLHNSEQRIIHGDIKPANLMLTPQGDICLIDFNVSLLQGGEADETIGYSEYYAPVEQLIQVELGRQNLSKPPRGGGPIRHAPEESDDVKTEIIGDDGRQGTGLPQMSLSEFRSQKAGEMIKIYGENLRVDERSDIYSACATMYHILTGKRPAPCYMEQIPVEAAMPSVSDAFAGILTRGLEQDPRKRYKSASQMLGALRKLPKMAKSYKRLLRRQDLAVVLLLAVFLGSAGAAYEGWAMRGEEALAGKLADAQEYYADGRYGEGAEYLEKNVLDNPRYQKSGLISEGHYLAAGCYLEMGDLSKAVAEYQKAIFLDGTRPIYYRDYGIALARSGDLGQARESLLQAEASGLENSGLKLLEGEIDSLEGDYQGAAEALSECLKDSEDDSDILRATLKLDEVLEEQSGDDAYPDRIRLLEDSRNRLSEEKLPMLLQRLTQAYGDYGQLLGDASYTKKAVDALEEIIGMGYGTIVEWLDMAVYLQSMGSYAESEECLLEADRVYPDNYLIYKRLAFLELEVPDYEKFGTYFKKCDDLYQKRPSGAEQDMEMEYLYQIYGELSGSGQVGG